MPVLILIVVVSLPLLLFLGANAHCFERILEHIQLIVGTTASPAFLQRLTYLAMTHDPRVLQVDTCRAYNAGSTYWVEVDIVLPPDMILCEAHDIGEALQIKLEQLPNVERAFVHLDFETSHPPEHRKIK